MNNKYIYGSLCSIAPIIISKIGYTWIIDNIIFSNSNRFTTKILITESCQIISNNNTVCKFILTPTYLSKKIDNLFSNKNNLYLSIISKINFLNNIFLLYNNSIGLKLLQQHKKLQFYKNYSQDIRDYKYLYSTVELKILLYDLNKIISQNSKCIFEYKIQTFKNILQAIMINNINNPYIYKINTILTNNTIFTEIYNKYIKSMNYYINLGELFKNV